MYAKSIVLFFVLAIIFACTKDQMPLSIEFDNNLRSFLNESAETGHFSYYQLPSESDLENIPQDPLNPLTPEKVELGKLLFFETALAQDAMFEAGLGTYSCASCHIPEAGFKPGAFQGVADGGIGYGANGENRVRNQEYQEDQLDVQSARPLSLINVAYVTNTFWNGQFGSTGVNVGTEEVWDDLEETELNHLGYEGIETQNFEGLKVHRIAINKPLLDQFGYTSMFDAAFPDVDTDQRYSQFTGALALSAYLRTILSNQAPFQKWLKGEDSAMSIQEKKGAILFFGKAKCNNCHYRPNLGSLEFHALGVKDMYDRPSFNTNITDRRNLGRGGFTGDEEDNFKFKVPQLYNIDDSQFFFHGSSKLTLDEVIDYKIKAQTENPNVAQELISDQFLPLQLSDEEVEDLKSFLRISLRDPDLVRYKPEEILSGQCFPNNDPQSQIDLGCN